MRTGAVIAAAGMSTRMEGSFKPMLPLGEETVSRRLVKAFQAARVDTIVVVTGYRAFDLERHLADLGVVCLKNELYDRSEMFDSARIGLSYLLTRCDRMFFTPVDAPLVQPETLQALLDSGAPVAVPSFDMHAGHPILLSREAAEKVAADSGEGGLRGAIGRSGFERAFVTVPDSRVLLDMDTPEDYRKIQDQS